jgi:hypothetical protein
MRIALYFKMEGAIIDIIIDTTILTTLFVGASYAEAPWRQNAQHLLRTSAASAGRDKNPFRTRPVTYYTTWPACVLGFPP